MASSVPLALSLTHEHIAAGHANEEAGTKEERHAPHVDGPPAAAGTHRLERRHVRRRCRSGASL